MCGIAGYNLNPTDNIDAPALSRWLLHRIETRGRDASGAAWSDAEGVWYDKAPIVGSRFANRVPIPPLSRNVILHTRAATGGDPSDNRNNHPFPLPGITGIHNGVLDSGWRDTFKELRIAPISSTDSEAIFARLAYSDDDVVTDLSKVKGDVSVAWLDADEPDALHLARLHGRPLAIGETTGGSLVFASTTDLLRGACAAAGVRLRDAENVPEWTYLKVLDGIVRISQRIPHQVKRLTPPKRQNETYWAWQERVADYDHRDQINPQLRLGV